MTAPGWCRVGVLLTAVLLAAVLVAFGPAHAQSEAQPAAEAAEDRVLVFIRLPPEHFRPNAAYGGYQDASARRATRRIAGRQAERHGLTLVDDWPLPLLGLDCYVMAVPAGRSPDEMAAALSDEPNVAWAEPMGRFRAEGGLDRAEGGLDSAEGGLAHDDPLFDVQPAAVAWRLAALHEIATGRGVPIAVIDSTIEAQHPDLLDQVTVRRDFVAGRPAAAEAHGTAVAGVIAALAGNGQGVVGVAPEARLLALRACWQDDAAGAGDETVCDTLSLAKALHFAIEARAEVINLSLSGPPAPVLARLLDAAIERGIVVVAALDPAAADGGFPASHRGVVAVADAPAMGGGSAFVAPGRDVPTTQPEGRWSFVNGNSYAAAHVSGLFALLGERGAPPTAASLVTATSGTIDACETLLRAAPCPQCACATGAEGWTSAQQ
jgi:subtilisin family serine protease